MYVLISFSQDTIAVDYTKSFEIMYEPTGGQYNE